MIFEMGESRSKGVALMARSFRSVSSAQRRKLRAAKGSTAIKRSCRFLFGRSRAKPSGENSVACSHMRTQMTVEQHVRVSLNRWRSLNSGDRASYPFQCIGVLTDGKAKTFEWVEFGFDVPPPCSTIVAAMLVDNALVFANDCGGIIASVFAHHFGGTSRKAERHRTLKTRMVDSYWAALAGDFRHFVLGWATASAARRV